ncbi:PKD domain-containing protein [Flaviaesturariibacter terrae]
MRKLYFLLIALLLAAGSQAQDSCRAEFSIQQLNGNSLPITLQTTAVAWHNHQKAVISVCWTWGDGTPVQCSQRSGTTAPSMTGTHIYPANGTYTIGVTINYDGGCSSSFTRTVVLPAPSPTVTPDSCHASFTAATVSAGPMAQIVHFEAQPWHNHQRRVTQVCWQFGDGHDTCVSYGAATTVPFFVNHNYSAPGNYSACVKIVYDGGCQSTYCHNVSLAPPADSCSAHFTLQAVAAQPLGRRFVAQPWHNNGKRVTSVCWNFGDGRDSCVNYPAGFVGDYAVPHSYSYPGTYTVCVRINYEGGCHSLYCAPVVVHVVTPAPVPDSSCHVNFVSLADSFLHRRFAAVLQGSRRPLRICWNFGDGSSHCEQLSSTSTANALLADHVYSTPGHYQVCVRIEYDGGCVAQECHEILVTSPGNCTVSFSKQALSDRHFQFVAAGTTDPGDTPTWRWSFGDGSAAQGRQVEHSYAGGGTYQVCVSMITASGCQARYCDTVTVHAPVVTLLTLVPNPVSTVLHANFHSAEPGTATIRIVSATGLIVRTETRPCYAGMNFWQLNVSALPTGYYQLVVQTNTQFAASGFFKQ